jgi:putative tricarboxylic transport membrane protein
MLVFVPTALFCLAVQYLMRLVGKIALWKSLLTAFLFTAICS